MAQTAELLTKIVADNNQFKAKLKESTAAVKGFAAETNSIWKDVGKGFLAAFSVGAIISTLKGVSNEIDDMAASAQKLGVSLEGFQHLEYAAKRSDVEIGTLETGLARLRTTAAKALGGNQGAIKAFQDLGIEVKDLNQPVDELYAKISSGLKGKGNQVGLVNAIFGNRAGQEQLNLLLNDLKALTQESKALGGALNDLDAAKFAEMDKATDQLVTTIQRDLQGALIALTPVITGVAKAFSSMSKAAGGAFSEISRGLGEGATAARELITGSYDPNAGSQSPTSMIQNKIANASSGVSSIPNFKQGSKTDTFGPVIQLETEFGKLASASAAAASALTDIGNKQLKDVFGIGDVSGKAYLQSILTQKPQAMDDTFTKISNELRDIVQDGGNTNGVPFQSGLKLLEQIARDSGLNKDTTNTGMTAAVQEIKQAAGLIKKQEVNVIVTVKDNEFISAVVDSSRFASAVTDTAVKAADDSARQAVR